MFVTVLTKTFSTNLSCTNASKNSSKSVKGMEIVFSSLFQIPEKTSLLLEVLRLRKLVLLIRERWVWSIRAMILTRTTGKPKYSEENQYKCPCVQRET
jgi:hypothetical protein